MKTEYQFVRFVMWPHTSKNKTYRWDCRSIRHGYQLGTVEWHGGWRQYAFAPQALGKFSAVYLADIRDFILQAMDEHKKAVR